MPHKPGTFHIFAECSIMASLFSFLGNMTKSALRLVSTAVKRVYVLTITVRAS
jgi:hypothetical protein